MWKAPVFTVSGLSANSYRLFFPFIENPEMAAYLRQHTESAVRLRLRQVLRTSRFDEVTLSLAIRGLTGTTRNMKIGKFDPERERRRMAKGRRREAIIDAQQYAVFLETLQFAKQRGVQTVLVHMPTVDILNQFDVEKNRRCARSLQHWRQKIRPSISSISVRRSNPGTIFSLTASI